MAKQYISNFNELDCLRGIAYKLGGNAGGANELGALRTIVTLLDVVPGNRTVGNMNEVDCLRAIVRHYAAAGPAFDADAQDFFTRGEAAGGTYAATTKTAVNAYVVGTKADGDWELINHENLFCTDGFTGMTVPLKVGFGAATDTIFNFVAGDYSLATGLTGNGVNKYLNTVLLANALTANDTHLAVYNRTSGAAGGNLTMGTKNTASSLNFDLFAPFSDGTIYSDQYNETGGQGRLSFAITGAAGFIIGTRTAANVHTIYRNGSSVAANASTGGSLPALAIFVFARNDSGTPTGHVAHNLAAYSIGSGVSAAAAARRNARMQTLQTAFSRNV